MPSAAAEPDLELERETLDLAPDRILVSRAADGDVRAFRALVMRHTRAMRAYAWRLLGREADVDDVVQDAFISAWAHLGDLGDGAAVQSWLFRIVSRKSFDSIRLRKEHSDLSALEDVASALLEPDYAAEGESFEVVLRSTLDSLPVPQGQVWFLREVGGYSYQEISRDLGLPVTTVRGLLARARSTLVQRMEGWR